MSVEVASDYLGVSAATFIKEVEAGVWPRPIARDCRRNTWDRKQLDDAVDRLGGTGDARSPEDELIERARNGAA
jgi:hypothetical protein